MFKLSELKAGDEVAVMRERRWRYEAPSEFRIVPIERVTPTQVIADGKRWNRATGAAIPADRLYPERIVPATDEHRHAAERKALWRPIDEAFVSGAHRYESRHQLSTETLRTIAAALLADPAVQRWAAK